VAQGMSGDALAQAAGVVVRYKVCKG